METKEKVARGLAGAAMAAALTLLAGCCVEAPVETYGAARIISEPAGAGIVDLRSNAALGSTPLDHVWETADWKAEYIQLVLTSAGHEDTVTSFWINPRHATREEAAQNPQTITVLLPQKK
ncbi:MAG: hypothetical protein WCZ10_13495 [Desulfobulbaceae bacterium]